jgi:hypothetical protein
MRDTSGIHYRKGMSPISLAWHIDEKGLPFLLSIVPHTYSERPRVVCFEKGIRVCMLIDNEKLVLFGKGGSK